MPRASVALLACKPGLARCAVSCWQRLIPVPSAHISRCGSEHMAPLIGAAWSTRRTAHRSFHASNLTCPTSAPGHIQTGRHRPACMTPRVGHTMHTSGPPRICTSGSTRHDATTCMHNIQHTCTSLHRGSRCHDGCMHARAWTSINMPACRHALAPPRTHTHTHTWVSQGLQLSLSRASPVEGRAALACNAHINVKNHACA